MSHQSEQCLRYHTELTALWMAHSSLADLEVALTPGFLTFSVVVEFTKPEDEGVRKKFDVETSALILRSAEAEKLPPSTAKATEGYVAWADEFARFVGYWKRQEWQEDRPYGLLTLNYLDECCQAKNDTLLSTMDLSMLRIAISHRCHHCGVHGKVMRCLRCELTHYCSRECQRSAWPEHKGHCRKGGCK